MRILGRADAALVNSFLVCSALFLGLFLGLWAGQSPASAVGEERGTSSPAAGGHAPRAGRAAATWSGTLSAAIAHIPVGTEVRTGYSRDLFKLWVDADGDGCDTREEVLISEAEEAPTLGSGCSLSGGRWYSYYDGVSQYDAGDLDIDHVVPLAEAWDSGARDWSADRREAYANDLGDSHTLVGVTASVNRSKGDQDLAEWLPEINDCQYLRDWVEAKIRWGLDQDAAEQDAAEGIVSGCTDSSFTVPLAD